MRVFWGDFGLGVDADQDHSIKMPCRGKQPLVLSLGIAAACLTSHISLFAMPSCCLYLQSILGVLRLLRLAALEFFHFS